MHHRLAVLLATLALVTTARAEAKCLRLPIVVELMTATNTGVAPGGGVLVGLGYGKQADRQDDIVEKPAWRFKQNGKLVVPTIKILAPGLALYELGGDGGTLIDDKQRPLVTIRRAKPGAALAIPKVKAASTEGSDESTKWPVQSRLLVELAGAPPPGVRGMILYRNKQPVNWTRIDPKATGASFHSGGHCGNDLPGTSVPASGDLTVAYFDSTGRVSEPTPVLAITKQ